MLLAIIVAAAENNAIGIDNQLPWHLPKDLQFFKKTTLGKPVLMGRKTFESLGKPLPGRLNIVISKQKDLLLPDGVLLFDDIDNALQRMEEENQEEAFIIGGAKIFEQTLHLADRIYLTKVHTVVENATTFFPSIDHTHWHLTWEEAHEADEKNSFAFTFQRYENTVL
jgi:dihydrofolate reductase